MPKNELGEFAAVIKNTPRERRRDVMINLAVTRMPRIHGIDVLGEKENEIQQWAAEIYARQVPITVKKFSQIMQEFYYHLLVEMRAAGFVRD